MLLSASRRAFSEECISYSMPAFRLNGRVIAGFLATKKGGSYFPFSGTTLATLSDVRDDFGRTKSALHFDAENSLTVPLLRKLLKARIAECNVKHTIGASTQVLPA